MKTLLVKITSTLIVASSLLATANAANAWGFSVNGYFKNDGTYVMPHFRTPPDSSIINNYSYWK